MDCIVLLNLFLSLFLGPAIRLFVNRPSRGIGYCLLFCVSVFVRPTLCTTSTVQDYIGYHQPALCTTDLHCAPCSLSTLTVMTFSSADFLGTLCRPGDAQYDVVSLALCVLSGISCTICSFIFVICAPVCWTSCLLRTVHWNN